METQRLNEAGTTAAEEGSNAVEARASAAEAHITIEKKTLATPESLAQEIARALEIARSVDELLNTNPAPEVVKEKMVELSGYREELVAHYFPPGADDTMWNEFMNIDDWNGEAQRKGTPNGIVAEAVTKLQAYMLPQA